MSEFEPKVFERVVEDPNPKLSMTDVMVLMAQQGMLRAFEPDEEGRVNQSDIGTSVRVSSPNSEDSCKSNVHPSLSAGEGLQSRSFSKNRSNGGRG